MQILARIGRDFADRATIDRALKIDHGEIIHLQCAIRHVGKIGRLFPQPLKRGIDLLVFDLNLRQLDCDALVIRQIEFRRGHDGRAKSNRFVVAQLDIFEVR